MHLYENPGVHERLLHHCHRGGDQETEKQNLPVNMVKNRSRVGVHRKRTPSEHFQVERHSEPIASPGTTDPQELRLCQKSGTQHHGVCF